MGCVDSPCLKSRLWVRNLGLYSIWEYVQTCKCIISEAPPDPQSSSHIPMESQYSMMQVPSPAPKFGAVNLRISDVSLSHSNLGQLYSMSHSLTVAAEPRAKNIFERVVRRDKIYI